MVFTAAAQPLDALRIICDVAASLAKFDLDCTKSLHVTFLEPAQVWVIDSSLLIIPVY